MCSFVCQRSLFIFKMKQTFSTAHICFSIAIQTAILKRAGGDCLGKTQLPLTVIALCKAATSEDGLKLG